jgi:hypothetical protein
MQLCALIVKLPRKAVLRFGSDLIASFMVKEFYTGIANVNVSTGTQPNFGWATATKRTGLYFYFLLARNYIDCRSKPKASCSNSESPFIRAPRYPKTLTNVAS